MCACVCGACAGFVCDGGMCDGVCDMMYVVSVMVQVVWVGVVCLCVLRVSLCVWMVCMCMCVCGVLSGVCALWCMCMCVMMRMRDGVLFCDACVYVGEGSFGVSMCVCVVPMVVACVTMGMCVWLCG